MHTLHAFAIGQLHPNRHNLNGPSVKRHISRCRFRQQQQQGLGQAVAENPQVKRTQGVRVYAPVIFGGLIVSSACQGAQLGCLLPESASVNPLPHVWPEDNKAYNNLFDRDVSLFVFTITVHHVFLDKERILIMSCHCYPKVGQLHKHTRIKEQRVNDGRGQIWANSSATPSQRRG